MTSSMTIAKRKSNPTSEIWHVRYVKYCLRSNWQKIVFFCWQNASFPLLKTYQLHLFVANIKIWHHSWIFSCLSPEIQILRILESESGANLESIKTLEMSVLRNGLYELCQLQELVLENMVKIVRLVKLVNLTKLVNLMKLATLVKLSNLMRLVKLSNLVGFHFSQFQICTLSILPLLWMPIHPATNHVLHPPRQAVFCICLLTQLIKQIPKKSKTEIGLGDQLEASALCYNFMLFSCH